MLPRILSILRNGYLSKHAEVSFTNVRFCTEVLDILWKENLIRGYVKTSKDSIKVFLGYHEGYPMCRRLIGLSSPHKRLYITSKDLYRMLKLFDILIVSTPKGIMTAKKAVLNFQGGELLVYAA